MRKYFLFLSILILFSFPNIFGMNNLALTDISPEDFFGHDIATIGDVDGDGITDMAVGAPYDDDGGESHGAVYILFLNSDGTVKNSQKISSTEGNFQQNLQTQDAFGFALSELSDINNDGVVEIVVGSPHRYYFDSELSPVHLLQLEKNGIVKSFETIPPEKNTEINYNVFYLLMIPFAFIFIFLIIIKIKHRIAIQK